LEQEIIKKEHELEMCKQASEELKNAFVNYQKITSTPSPAHR